MESNSRLSQQEYDKLSLEYEANPPKLSGKPGFLTTAEVIQYSIKKQLATNA
jgi:hypothetical protein